MSGFWSDTYARHCGKVEKSSLVIKPEDAYTTSLIDLFPFDAFETGGFEYTHSPIINEVHSERISKNMELQIALGQDKNWTNLFFKDIIWRLGKGYKNFIVTGYGYTGVGKSSVSQFWGMVATQFVNQIKGKELERKYGRLAKFDNSNICMSRSEFLDRIEETIPGETVIFDEDDQSRIGLGSGRQWEEMEKIEKVTRAEQINFWYNSPMFETHNEHYMIKGLDSSHTHAMDRAVLYVKDNNLMYEPFAHFITPHTIMESYHEKKMDYIEKVKKKTTNENFKEYDKVAREMVDRFPGLFYKKNVKDDTVSPNLKFDGRIVRVLTRRYYPRFGENEYADIIASIRLSLIDFDALEVDLRTLETDRASKIEDFVEGGVGE